MIELIDDEGNYSWMDAEVGNEVYKGALKRYFIGADKKVLKDFDNSFMQVKLADFLLEKRKKEEDSEESYCVFFVIIDCCFNERCVFPSNDDAEDNDNSIKVCQCCCVGVGGKDVPALPKKSIYYQPLLCHFVSAMHSPEILGDIIAQSSYDIFAIDEASIQGEFHLVHEMNKVFESRYGSRFFRVKDPNLTPMKKETFCCDIIPLNIVIEWRDDGGERLHNHDMHIMAIWYNDWQTYPLVLSFLC
jgi:hypothetical protein